MNESQGRLLIVEDDSALRRSLRTTLGVLGFDVTEASNGEDALVRLRTVGYEAVLLDINMPGIGGIETCRRIRHVSTRLPILMLTVRDSEDDKVEALEVGADDYVTKPFQTRELIARIRAAVRRFRAPERPAEMPITIGVFVMHGRVKASSDQAIDRLRSVLLEVGEHRSFGEADLAAFKGFQRLFGSSLQFRHFTGESEHLVCPLVLLRENALPI